MLTDCTFTTYLGIAAIQVLSNSIFGSTFGFRSPLKDKIDTLGQKKLRGGKEIDTSQNTHKQTNKKQKTKNRIAIVNDTNAATSSGSGL